MACPLRVPDRFPEHPGGESNLESARQSKRPDLLFLSYHMGLDLDGKIAKEAKAKGTTMPTRGPLFDELHAAVAKARKDHPEAFWWWRGYCLLLTVLVPYTYYTFVTAPSYTSMWCFTLVLVSYMFNIFHMRLHKGKKLYNNPILDGLTQPFYNFVDNVFGVHVEHWLKAHNGAHHLYTNNHGLDPDINVTFNLLRFVPTQDYKWYNKYQWFYAPVLFSIATVFFPISNLLKRNGPKWAFAAWVTLTWLVPFCLHGTSGLAWSATMYPCGSIFIAYLFAVPHAHVELDPSQAADAATLGIDDWIKMQALESISWGGWASNYFYGGINYQLEHHICPALDVPIYHHVQPEFKRILEKHGVKYNYEPTFFTAMLAYHKHLYAMGCPPAEYEAMQLLKAGLKKAM